ncbi:dnaJ domain protein [Lysobacter antibioticus]|uniref:hypothetical protein n=1 Tax=Lysobacter antibioticus TaxID=84531 RepID=UPI0007175541|nr:hypothetical protein [Lysobacter antibioticus]ALN64542.1 dnaJ domain protein [Lysobacter antibioticus]
MTPFARLGLNHDADESQVKRAYARELRKTRPDEDPVAFQQLHEAYAQCLEWARRPRAEAAIAVFEDLDELLDDNDALPSLRLQTPTAAPAGRAATPPAPIFDRAAVVIGAFDSKAFDSDAFLEQLLRIARESTSQELERWLRDHPDLYSVERKQELAPALIARLQHEPSLYIAQLDIVLAFFDLDTVHPRTASLQPAVADLRAYSQARGADFRGLQFDPDPRPGKRGRHPLALSPSVLFFLLMLLVAIARVIKAANGA